MNAAVVVEFLVAGVGALAWIALGILLATGSTPVDILAHARGWEQLATVVTLAAAYTLGVFVDRLADCLLSLGPVSRLARHVGGGLAKLDLFHEAHRIQVLVAEKRASFLLDHIRSGIRVARATTLNVFLAVVFGALLVGRNSGFPLGLAVFVLGFLLVSVCFLMYADAEHVFRGFAKRAADKYARPAKASARPHESAELPSGGTREQ